MSELHTDEALLNHTYFVALRSAALASIPEACAKYGVDSEFAVRVSQMSLVDIEKLALQDLLVFKPSIPTGQFLRMVGLPSENTRHILARLSIKSH